MYYKYTNGTIAYADEVLSNFLHVAAGNKFSFTQTADGLLETVGSTYNLGASTTTWNRVYCDHLNIGDSITSVDRSLWVLKGEETLTDTATSIEFTGLNGDDDETYMIHIRANNTANSGSARMILNNDSSASYGWQRMTFDNAAGQSANRLTGQNSWFVATTNTGTSFLRMILYAKTGTERMAIYQMLQDADLNDVQTNQLFTLIWDEVNTTITSLKLYPSADSFGTGTTIKIWGRQ